MMCEDIYIVKFRIPASTLDTAINEVMAVKGADCLEARLLMDAVPDPGPDTRTWFTPRSISQ